jgi:hypothetical protein
MAVHAKGATVWAWSAPQRLLALDTFRIWDWEKHAFVAIVAGRGTAAAWLPGAKALAVYDSAMGDLFHVDAATGKTLRLMERVVPPPGTGRFSHDGRLLAVNFTQNGLRFLDSETGKTRATLIFLTDAVAAPKGKKADEPHSLIVGPSGHFRSSSAKFEQELVYMVQTSQGHEVLSLSDFARKYGWKNDPTRSWASK